MLYHILNLGETEFKIQCAAAFDNVLNVSKDGKTLVLVVDIISQSKLKLSRKWGNKMIKSMLFRIR